MPDFLSRNPTTPLTDNKSVAFHVNDTVENTHLTSEIHVDFKESFIDDYIGVST